MDSHHSPPWDNSLLADGLSTDKRSKRSRSRSWTQVQIDRSKPSMLSHVVPSYNNNKNCFDGVSAITDVDESKESRSPIPIRSNTERSKPYIKPFANEGISTSGTSKINNKRSSRSRSQQNKASELKSETSQSQIISESKPSLFRGLSRGNKSKSSSLPSIAENTEGGEESKYTNATKQTITTRFTAATFESYLTTNIPDLTSGQCLFTELKNIKSWNIDFALPQLLGGLAVMCAQFPECLSYAYIAGIDPFHALQATWIANILTPIVGGSPGLMCGSSGLGAIAIRFVMAYFGKQYIWYAVMMSGLCQVLFGVWGLGKYIRLLPPGHTIGMVNALCVLLVLLQLRYFKEFPGMEDGEAAAVTLNEAIQVHYTIEEHIEVTTAMEEPTRYLESISSTSTDGNLNQTWEYYYGYDLPWNNSTFQIYTLCLQAFSSLTICFLLPRLTIILPSSFVALVVVSLTNFGLGELTEWGGPTVGDYCTSEFPSSKTYMGIFHSSYTLPSLSEWSTFAAIIPAGLSLLCINLLETMVTINVVDKCTDTESHQDGVFCGQGIANLAGGFMGGMGSAGSPHASLHGLRMGSVTSVSVFFAGISMLLASTFAYPAVKEVSLGATMGVTLYLVLNMMQWAPLVAFILKIVPDCLFLRRPELGRFRLATPDLISTFATTAIATFGSTYLLVGYLVGVLCYMCDQVGHAIILSENGDRYIFASLKFSKPPVIEKKEKVEKANASLEKDAPSRQTEEYTTYDEEFEDVICDALCGDRV